MAFGMVMVTSVPSISKETLDTISLSMGANYEIKEVVFNVGDRELYKIEVD